MAAPNPIEHALVRDACAACDRPLWSKFRHWLNMDSMWGLVLCAAYCSDECAAYAHLDPEAVAERLRARKLQRAG
jgi:hypothetical protein